MKKRKILNICLFSIALFFCFIALTSAEGCVLGEETTKDVKGALRIFQIIAPIALLGFTIIDAIKAINSGGSFHFADGGDMPAQKLVSRFVKRMIGVLLLFIFIGIWGEGEGCDLTDGKKTPTKVYQCYQCNGNGSIKKWKTNSDADDACPSAYHVTNDTEDSCKPHQCYQCNGNSSIKKWKYNSDADSDCPSAYHIFNATQAECK